MIKINLYWLISLVEHGAIDSIKARILVKCKIILFDLLTKNLKILFIIRLLINNTFFLLQKIETC